MNFKDYIRTIPNYPKQGIMFRDITSLLQHPEAFQYCIDTLANRYEDLSIDAIVGIDSRGFIFGSALAYKLGKSFIPVRKKGKLPGDTYAIDYDLEYGSDTLEIHKDALKENANVVIMDDLLATGGTIGASIQLVEKLNANIIETAFVVDLPDLGGSNGLKEKGYKVFSLVEYSGH